MEPEKKERINRKDDTTKSQRRYLATDTEKAKHAYSDVKSSFEAGKVHSITFKPILPNTIKQVYKQVTIYRKLSEQEYDKLRKNKIYFIITPENVTEHSSDVYYITLPNMVRGLRQGGDHKFFIELSIEKFNALSDENKKKIKIELVPINDIIEKGIGATPITSANVKNYIDADKKKTTYVPKAQTKTDTGKYVPAANTPSKSGSYKPEDRKKVTDFYNANESLVTKLKNAYNSNKDPNSADFNTPESKDKYRALLIEFLDKVDEFTDSKELFDVLLDYTLKLKVSEALLKLIKVSYYSRHGIKENMKKVKEMSTTGTGAFATPGEGEGMATKYAFAGAGADPKKKKKLKEETQTKDDLGKATMIYDVIKNTVMNMTVKKALANLPKVKEFYINLEKAAGDIATLADKYEKSDSDKSNQLSEISSNIIKLDNVLSSLITIYEKAQSNPIK